MPVSAGAIHVRPALPMDGAAVATLVRRTWLSDYAHLLGAGRIDAFFDGKLECARSWLGERAAELGTWVASSGADVVGSAGVHLRKDGDAELSHLYVLKEHQGAGVGSVLLDSCCRALRQQGSLSLCMWVLEQTPAVAFYRKHNATVIGRDVTVLGEHAEPTLRMRIRLWARRPPNRPWIARRAW